MAKNKYNWSIFFIDDDGYIKEFKDIEFLGEDKKEAIRDFRKKIGERYNRRYKRVKIVAIFRKPSGK